jgi:hypothetical protein
MMNAVSFVAQPCRAKAAPAVLLRTCLAGLQRSGHEFCSTRGDENWRKRGIVWFNGHGADPWRGSMIARPLVSRHIGGIDLEKIGPKARVK